ncbi:hypothetical protein [Nocardioides marmoriginsengisoli]|uniref:hypothetical protein n=1 Tax=Nocardioides marmoriginsengisoli TaxID=661483 RepID=UPI0016143A7C|nr:hypothetical protein [Nocardioides marmoriginsengisoli]
MTIPPSLARAMMIGAVVGIVCGILRVGKPEAIVVLIGVLLIVMIVEDGPR